MVEPLRFEFTFFSFTISFLSGVDQKQESFEVKLDLHYVRPCHLRPYGDRPFSLKTLFLMQKLHKPVVKQNMVFSDFICYSVRYDFQHNNGILTICIPSPTA